MKNIKVTVLLSAYNGEKYIKEQVDSILNQINVNIKLIIRDDGSNEQFRKILAKYAEYDKRIAVIYGDNKGVVSSFLELIETAPESDYYALADQDDVWYEDKLQRAVEMLEMEKKETALLYAANQNHVDKNRKFLIKHFESEPQISLTQELFGNKFSGCTMVFNSKFLELMQNDKHLREIAFFRMHDTWMMFLALIYGKFIYDKMPVMDFRRHGNNVSNGGISSESIKTKIKNNFLLIIGKKSNNYYVSKTASILIKNCNDRLSKSEKYNFDLIANYKFCLKKKIKLCFCYSFFKEVGISLPKAAIKIFLNRY